MKTDKATATYDQEAMAANHHHHLICWKSIIGGVLITLMGFMILTALGAAVAGFTAESLINHEENGSTLLSGAGLWLGLSAVISLFCGGYFTLRVSRFMTNRIGAAHGFIVASIFFILLMIGAGNLLGGAASGVGKLAQGAGNSAADLSSTPFVQDTINKSFGTSKFKSEPKVVAQELSVRLLQGDVESAKSYYAYQTDLPQAEVDQKVVQLKNDFDAAMKRAGEKTAHAVGDTGLCLFIVFLAGLIAAVMGGRTGAHQNITRPFAKRETETSSGFVGLQSQRGSVAPYIFGWLLGVPVSILFLIAMLRTIF